MYQKEALIKIRSLVGIEQTFPVIGEKLDPIFHGPHQAEDEVDDRVWQHRYPIDLDVQIGNSNFFRSIPHRSSFIGIQISDSSSPLLLSLPN